MSERRPELEVDGLDGELPPPSAKLEQLVAASQPVALRRPLVGWALTLLAAGAYAVLWFLVMHLRPDLPYVSRLVLAGSAAVWMGSFVVATYFALVPRGGQVLLDGMRALRVGVFLLATLLFISAQLVVEAEGHSQPGTSDLMMAWHCARFALMPWLVLVAVTWRSVRHVAVATPWQIGGVLGLAGGALSGLLLTFICPIGGAAHAVLGHFGGVVLGALLGALLGGWAMRR